MEFIKSIDDRLIMVGLTVAMLGAYVATRDPLLGESLKYMLGATAGIMVARSQKTLITSSDANSSAAVKEFLGGK